MGCKVSKSADAVASISTSSDEENQEVGPEGDHGELMPLTHGEKKVTTRPPPVKGREAFSPGGGGGAHSRPVPRARTFLEDSDEPASDPAKLRELDNSAPVPLLGQPGYLAHNSSSSSKSRGGGGVTTTMEIEELQEDWDAALGRRSGTKARPSTTPYSAFPVFVIVPPTPVRRAFSLASPPLLKPHALPYLGTFFFPTCWFPSGKIMVCPLLSRRSLPQRAPPYSV